LYKQKVVYCLWHNCTKIGVWEAAWERKELRVVVRDAESYSPDSGSRMQRVRPPRKPLLRIEVLGAQYRVFLKVKYLDLLVNGLSYLPLARSPLYVAWLFQ
jgi:hypothetical protein